MIFLFYAMLAVAWILFVGMVAFIVWLWIQMLVEDVTQEAHKIEASPFYHDEVEAERLRAEGGEASFLPQTKTDVIPHETCFELTHEYLRKRYPGIELQ